MKVIIDFKKIKTDEDFYSALSRKIELPDYFGNNLDALYDVISGDLKMPLKIQLINLSSLKAKRFQHLLDTLNELKEEIEGFYFQVKG